MAVALAQSISAGRLHLPSLMTSHSHPAWTQSEPGFRLGPGLRRQFSGSETRHKVTKAQSLFGSGSSACPVPGFVTVTPCQVPCQYSHGTNCDCTVTLNYSSQCKLTPGAGVSALALAVRLSSLINITTTREEIKYNSAVILRL